MPFLYSRVIKKDPTVKWWMFILGPALFKRPTPAEADQSVVPNYAVVQEDEDEAASTRSPGSVTEDDGVNKGESGSPDLAITSAVAANGTDVEKSLATTDAKQPTYKELVAQGQDRLDAKLRKGRGPAGLGHAHAVQQPHGAPARSTSCTTSRS